MPLHNQQLSDGFNTRYAFSENSTMAIMFDKIISQNDRVEIIKIINGNSSKRIYNPSKRGAEIYCDTQPLLNIRGWRYLTGIGGCNLPEKEAAKIQDEFVDFVLNKLTKKEREDSFEILI